MNGQPRGKPASVLVVDDDGDSAETVALMLEIAFGAKVDLASDAATAMRHLAERGPYDLIISDIVLAGEDGISLIRRIRNLPDAPSRSTPALAMTADAGPARIAAIREAGFQDCCVKPISTENLIALCTRHVPRLAT